MPPIPVISTRGCCPPRCKYTSHCAGSVHRVSSPVMCVGLLAEDGKNEMRVILLLTLPLCWRFSNMVGWSQWWAWHWIRLILFIFFIILTQLWKGSWSPNYPSKGFCCWCPFSWFLQQWPFSCSTVRNWLILSPCVVWFILSLHGKHQKLCQYCSFLSLQVTGSKTKKRRQESWAS